jgi:hypothetical protein
MVNGYLMHCHFCQKWIAIKDKKQTVTCRYCDKHNRIGKDQLLTFVGTYHEAYQQAIEMNRALNAPKSADTNFLPLSQRDRHLSE